LLILSGEGRAAAACGGRVGVVYAETLALQAVFVVQYRDGDEETHAWKNKH